MAHFTEPEPSAVVAVRGSRAQLLLTSGAFASILVCTFFVGGIWFRFNATVDLAESLQAGQTSINDQINKIDRRLVRIETRLEGARPAPHTDGS